MPLCSILLHKVKANNGDGEHDRYVLSAARPKVGSDASKPWRAGMKVREKEDEADADGRPKYVPAMEDR